MATLLNHIQCWMQRSIDETEERMEQKMSHPMERKIMELHHCLDAFGLRVLSRPAPPRDVFMIYCGFMVFLMFFP